MKTNEQTAAHLSAQRDYACRQHSCETLEQAYHRLAADRSQSQRRRVTETPDETAARLSAQREIVIVSGVILSTVLKWH